MGIYLDALKKNKKAGVGGLKNLKNPIKGSSLGFLGSVPPTLKIINGVATGPVHVRCGQCTHFIRDPVNPPGGIGTCAVAGEGAAGFVMYPHKPRVCGDFAATETPRP